MQSEQATAPTFELPNAGAGPDPFSVDEVTEDAVVVFFQRDYHCPKCRQQATTVEDRVDEFRDANTLPVAVLPESPSRTATWADSVGASYPVVADPDGDAGDAYDQPTRFGALGALVDLLGRMPLAVVLDTTGDEPRVAARYAGDAPGDRPSIDELLADCRTITT